MILGSLNFALFMALLQKNVLESLKNTEVKVYFGIIAAVTVLMGINLFLASNLEAGQALRQASFHSVSFASSTAYTIADYDLWPGFSKIILLALMAIGGCSSSTAGGMKVARVMVLGKMSVAAVKKTTHPKQVQSISMGNYTLGDAMQGAVLLFFFLFISIFVVASLCLSAWGYEPFEAMGASMAALGNTGSAFGAFGPGGGYSAAPDGAKILLGLCMLFGRLEIIPLLVLFSPDFWKRRKGW
jgi:trk system potassium uptake protein TrkH